MQRLEIEDCFVVPAYRRVQSEEGNYDAQCGFNIIARTKPDDKGNYGYWVCTGAANENGDMLARLYQTEKYAEGTANMIKGIGLIRIDRWYCFEEKNINDLPNYVTDPTNPRYN